MWGHAFNNICGIGNYVSILFVKGRHGLRDRHPSLFQVLRFNTDTYRGDIMFTYGNTNMLGNMREDVSCLLNGGMVQPNDIK
eukprot:9138964-Karenia_brevis.AAC.1